MVLSYATEYAVVTEAAHEETAELPAPRVWPETPRVAAKPKADEKTTAPTTRARTGFLPSALKMFLRIVFPPFVPAGSFRLSRSCICIVGSPRRNWNGLLGGMGY